MLYKLGFWTFIMLFIQNECFKNCDTKKLAMQIFKSNPGKSIVISPMIVKLMLGKLASVAKNDAKKELFEALGINKDYQIKPYYNKIKEMISKLKVGDTIWMNHIFVNYTDNINSSFITKSELDYGVDVRKVDFSTPTAAFSFINEILNVGSLRRIPPATLETGDISTNTTMVSITALLFKIFWGSPFLPIYSRMIRFRDNDNNLLQVPAMSRIDSSCKYYEDLKNNLQAAQIRLRLSDLSFMVIAPGDAIAFNKFLHELDKNPDIVQNIQKNMTYKVINLQLPMFKIKNHFDLKEHLQKIGLKKIFENASNCSEQFSILKNKTSTVHLDVVKHVASIDVNEGVNMRTYKGSVRGEHYSWPDRDMFVNRPFYFNINLWHEGDNTYEDILTGLYYGSDESTTPTTKMSEYGTNQKPRTY